MGVTLQQEGNNNISTSPRPHRLVGSIPVAVFDGDTHSRPSRIHLSRALPYRASPHQISDLPVFGAVPRPAGLGFLAGARRASCISERTVFLQISSRLNVFPYETRLRTCKSVRRQATTSRPQRCTACRRRRDNDDPVYTIVLRSTARLMVILRASPTLAPFQPDLHPKPDLPPSHHISSTSLHQKFSHPPNIFPMKTHVPHPYIVAYCPPRA
ncbi:hypothetical protein M422DRAFT_784392 [Sphaerobolus stellatus SS14]|uniref:Uncharacterized protein n=1 Tax=Sphaerobolus stellatus (strain SS14) TaxID=990650 RepID=A0A0C9UV09_SPHS4|nr:hypothetical protein M422DRAFT_784392 [Sphaerobolus stellatus SS14]